MLLIGALFSLSLYLERDYFSFELAYQHFKTFKYLWLLVPATVARSKYHEVLSNNDFYLKYVGDGEMAAEAKAIYVIFFAFLLLKLFIILAINFVLWLFWYLLIGIPYPIIFLVYFIKTRKKKNPITIALMSVIVVAYMAWVLVPPFIHP